MLEYKEETLSSFSSERSLKKQTDVESNIDLTRGTEKRSITILSFVRLIFEKYKDSVNRMLEENITQKIWSIQV